MYENALYYGQKPRFLASIQKSTSFPIPVEV